VAETFARSLEARLEEAVGLAQAIRLDVVRAEIARIASPRPSSLLGSGAVIISANSLAKIRSVSS